ncbi:hypothetical protein SAMN05518801_10860 [Novosphingobium sp. CF614]|uniref:hypothetical protein n=1 Tax=Novosphingobium sp. CF614 TaxID=1884364 RepID=UPI0008E10D1B|nr:hypothetical protein [Novosphingobium sp. CF614]SFG14223.1 hypothetical protein SAMN05518801_10860 [Novosphingobium sp. CF614]
MGTTFTAIERAFLVGAAILATISVSVKFVPKPADTVMSAPELFDQALARIDNIDTAEAEVRRWAGNNATPVATAYAIEMLLRKRFYHSYSYYSVSDDWVLWLASFLRSDVAQKVEPDDILKQPWAGCSQQAIVAQVLLKRFGFRFATLGTSDPKHFTSIASLNGIWYYVDSWDGVGRRRFGPISFGFLRSGLANSRFTGAYSAKWLSAITSGHFVIKDIDRLPGHHLRSFHSLTRFISKFGWVLCLLGFAAAWMLRVGLPAMKNAGVLIAAEK